MLTFDRASNDSWSGFQEAFVVVLPFATTAPMSGLLSCSSLYGIAASRHAPQVQCRATAVTASVVVTNCFMGSD